MPFDDYGSTDASNPNAAWAQTGLMADLNFTQPLGTGAYGIAGQLRLQANPTDENAIGRNLRFQSPGVNWRAQSDGWALGGLLAGGYISLPVGQNLYFQARGLLGIMRASSPYLYLEGTSSTGSAWVEQYSANTFSFGSQIGLGFELGLGANWSLLAFLDYTSAQPTFEDVELRTSTGMSDFTTIEQSINTLNASLGIGLKL